MHTEEIEDEVQFTGDRHVVVVGGGIAGMYCARELAKRDYRVTLLEVRQLLGGRIETLDLRGFSGKSALARRAVFKGECGPMRFELELQPRFAKLCGETGIVLKEFPGPRGEAPSRYALKPDEHSPSQLPLSPLELLKLGVFRMFGQETTFDKNEKVIPKDQSWLDNLEDDAPDGFEKLRRDAVFPNTGEKLYRLGFWNALTDVLSEGAVETIRNLGSFFHLISENPNAVEWGIFWLRLFKLPDGAPLSTIPGGVRLLAERLEAEFYTQLRQHVAVRLRHEVVQLGIGEGDEVEVHAIDRRAGGERNVVFTAPHVVLALPRAPLRQFSAAFPDEIRMDLEEVNGFRLLKAFLCMRRPFWWGAAPPLAQTSAWTVPTRELHYFEDESGHNAMMLLYADEPDAKFWTHFVEDRWMHDRAELGGNLALKRELVKLLLAKQHDAAAGQLEPHIKPGQSIAQAVSVLLNVVEELPGLEEHVQSLSDAPVLLREFVARTERFGPGLWASVSDYAIRDWAHEPDGAGCHAWRPNARSWEIRPRLRAFAMQGGPSTACLHICGEAYSDYQGFIEGALRSAADAVASIAGETPPHSS